MKGEEVSEKMLEEKDYSCQFVERNIRPGRDRRRTLNFNKRVEDPHDSLLQTVKSRE